ncbi:hypothetical protein V8C34DRAFT_236003 [Trichoderma compactum]
MRAVALNRWSESSCCSQFPANSRPVSQATETYDPTYQLHVVRASTNKRFHQSIDAILTDQYESCALHTQLNYPCRNPIPPRDPDRAGLTPVSTSAAPAFFLARPRNQKKGHRQRFLPLYLCFFSGQQFPAAIPVLRESFPFNRGYTCTLALAAIDRPPKF